MDDTATVATAEGHEALDRTDDAQAVEAEVDEELLVEEVSIDGMCGVY